MGGHRPDRDPGCPHKDQGLRAAEGGGGPLLRPLALPGTGGAVPAPLQAGRQRGGQPPTILCKGNKLHSHWDASR